jgi:polysaccharide transporter, PST family
MNLLGNTFELSDRYMLLHLIPGGEAEGQAAVGQYHSGRIFPTLMMSIALMLGGILMPYMTADWEAGRHEEVRAQLRRGLLAVAVVFTVGAAVTDILSPFIFGVLLEGRYDDGLSMMPMAFIFTTWSALVMIGQNYLWVLERGKWIAMTMGVGLVSNIALNALLIPIWGLYGAVIATLASNLVVLLGLWACLHRSGYPLDQSVILGTVLPATLLAGPWVSLLSCLAVALINRDVQASVAELVERRQRRRVAVTNP